MSDKTYHLENMLDATTQQILQGVSTGIEHFSAGIFKTEDARVLAQACREEKPMTLHHWNSIHGNMVVCASWSSHDGERPFVSLYAYIK